MVIPEEKTWSEAKADCTAKKMWFADPCGVEAYNKIMNVSGQLTHANMTYMASYRKPSPKVCFLLDISGVFSGSFAFPYLSSAK